MEHAPPKTENELRVQLSELVVRLGKKDRLPLLRRLTQGNQAAMEDLMVQDPLFVRDDAESPTAINLSPEIAELFPPSFHKHPTKWLESKPLIRREQAITPAPTINFLQLTPYDVSCVREFVLRKGKKSQAIVSKRIRRGSGEVERAKQAIEHGISTPRILGEVQHHGNQYALFERLPAVSLLRTAEYKGFHQWGRHHPDSAGSFLHGLEQAEIQLSPGQLDQLTNICDENKQKQELCIAYTILINLSETARLIVDLELGEECWDEAMDRKLGKHLKAATLLIQEFGLRTWADFRTACSRGVVSEEALRTSLKILRDQLNTDWQRATTKALFGTDILGGVASIRKKCEEAGLHHKDFGRRNILLEWDLEKDQPIEGREPKLWVIDWEDRAATKKESKEQA